MSNQTPATGSIDRAELGAQISRYAANVRDFFQATQRATLISPLFNVPARLVLGAYCYFDHAAWVLREVASQASPEEVGQLMRGVCVRPNFVNLSAIMLGYLNGRQQRRLRAGLKDDETLPGESLDNDALIVDFWQRCGSSYVGDDSFLPLETQYRLPILSREQTADLVALTRVVDREEQTQARRTMAIAELYTFILHGEARVGVFNHGPYGLGNGQALVVKELVGLQDDYLPWDLEQRPPLDNLARVMVLRDVAVSIDLFGSLIAQPFEFDEHIAAEALITIGDGQARPIDADEADATTDAAADAQLQMYEQAATWSSEYRVTYGADLYANLLGAFPRLVGLDLDDQIRDRFAETTTRAVPDLTSGDDRLLILERLGASDGVLYSTALPD